MKARNPMEAFAIYNLHNAVVKVVKGEVGDG